MRLEKERFGVKRLEKERFGDWTAGEYIYKPIVTSATLVDNETRDTSEHWSINEP